MAARNPYSGGRTRAELHRLECKVRGAARFVSALAEPDVDEHCGRACSARFTLWQERLHGSSKFLQRFS